MTLEFRCISGCIAAALRMAAACADDMPKSHQIMVDAAVTGQLGAFNGVTGVPAAKFAGPQDASKTDVSEGYKRARIDLILTYDVFGPRDIDVKFGASKNLPMSIPPDRSTLDIFPDMSADADDPRSYNFAPTDRLLQSIQSAGAATIFRIGRSIGSDPQPPVDLDKYAL
jgi:hypothetical protein